MKIEIDYNGAFAVCRIEPIDEPGKMVNFNDADSKSQTFAFGAFHTIEEHWRRELQREGVLIQSSFDIGSNPTISVLMNDNHTTVTTHGWLIQDTEGRWWGMDNGYHRMLEEYQKIKMERH